MRREHGNGVVQLVGWGENKEKEAGVPLKGMLPGASFLPPGPITYCLLEATQAHS